MGAILAPSFSPEAQAFVRMAYGVLLVLTLLITLPHARRFFVSDRWAGYARSDPRVDLVQNPWAVPVVMLAWLACGVLLTLGWATVPASFVNLVLCRYFFVGMRWKGILRGMGAPGFMTYWLAAGVFLLEYGVHHDPTGWVRSAALLALRVDFAVIMLCAGTYKVLAGYPKNHGMELGMINPWWGYWGAVYRRLSPRSWVFRTLNHLAYGTEIAAALLMLFPPTAAVGALLIFASFAFIAAHIRLGFLCEMVMLCAFLYVPEGHAVDRLLAGLVSAPVAAGAPAPWWLNAALTAALLGYVVLLPVAKVGQYYNLLARRPLRGILQAALDRYTNLFGIIIWRVFSVDHTNFFTRISMQDPATGTREPYARFDGRGPSTGVRYRHVGEFICLVSLFTTLKYYPSGSALFVERVVRYARTLPCPDGWAVVFEYVSITKEGDRFGERVIAEYVVEPRAGTVEERLLDASVSVRAPSAVSPVHEGVKPGSYAPARTA